MGGGALMGAGHWHRKEVRALIIKGKKEAAEQAGEREHVRGTASKESAGPGEELALARGGRAHGSECGHRQGEEGGHWPGRRHAFKSPTLGH